MSKIKTNCKFCNKDFYSHECWIKRGGGKYCSRICKSQFLLGKKQSIKTVEKRTKKTTGKGNGRWKGDLVGKVALHLWIYKNHGKADMCENRTMKVLWFPCSGISKIYHWANKKPYLYKRDRSNWLKLCASCHGKYDMTEEKKTRSRLIALRDIGFRNRNVLGQLI